MSHRIADKREPQLPVGWASVSPDRCTVPATKLAQLELTMTLSQRGAVDQTCTRIGDLYEDGHVNEMQRLAIVERILANKPIVVREIAELRLTTAVRHHYRIEDCRCKVCTERLAKHLPQYPEAK